MCENRRCRMKTNTEEMSMWARKCVLRFDARSFLFWSNCLNDHYSSIPLVNNWKDSMETKNLIKDSAPRTFNKHTLQNQSLWFLAVYLTSLYILFFSAGQIFSNGDHSYRTFFFSLFHRQNLTYENMKYEENSTRQLVLRISPEIFEHHFNSLS